MRRTLAAIAAVIALVALGGCGGGEQGSDKKADAAVSIDRPVATAAPAARPDAGTAAASTRPAAEVEPGTVHLVVIYTDELLRSEARALEEIEKAVARAAKGGKVTRAGASAEEKAFATAYLGATPPASPPVPPAGWDRVETVIVLEVLPASGVKPDRHTSGLGGVLVFRAPHVAPIYVERIASGAEGLRFDDNAPYSESSWPAWVAGIVTQLVPAAKGTP